MRNRNISLFGFPAGHTSPIRNPAPQGRGGLEYDHGEDMSLELYIIFLWGGTEIIFRKAEHFSFNDMEGRR
jgi:hypothetical protein